MCSLGPVSGAGTPVPKSSATSSLLLRAIRRKGKRLCWLGLEAAFILIVTIATSVFLLIEGIRYGDRLESDVQNRDRPLTKRQTVALGEGPFHQDGRPVAGLFTLGLLGKLSVGDVRPEIQTASCVEAPTASRGLDEGALKCD